MYAFVDGGTSVEFAVERATRRKCRMKNAQSASARGDWRFRRINLSSAIFFLASIWGASLSTCQPPVYTHGQELHSKSHETAFPLSLAVTREY
jgi:hypothetical protein